MKKPKKKAKRIPPPSDFHDQPATRASMLQKIGLRRAKQIVKESD